MAEAATPPTAPARATLTIRIIKSFAYRTEKNLVLHHVPLATTTTRQLKDQVRSALPTTPGFKPYLSLELDTLKVYFKAHQAKVGGCVCV
jgi:hypothetical protein